MGINKELTPKKIVEELNKYIIKTAENFIQSRLPVLNASLWTALEGWQTSGTGASGILLSDIFEPGKRKWLSVGGLSTDFFRHLDHNNQSINQSANFYRKYSYGKPFRNR